MATKKRRKSASLKGVADKLSIKKMGNDLKGPGLTLVGIAGAALLEKLALSKLTFLEPVATNQFSKFYKPAILLAAGLIGRQMTSNSMAKSLADGVTIFGGIKTVNAATGKDVMTGLSGMVPYREPRFVAPRQMNYELPTPTSIGKSI